MKKILFIILMCPFLCHAADFTIGGKRVVVFGESFNIGTITADNPAVVTCSGGSDICVNGGFDTDSIWVKTSPSITITGGKAIFLNCPNGQGIRQNCVTSNSFYEITWTLSDMASGQIRPYMGAYPSGTFSSDGTYTVILKASSDSAFYMFGVAGTTGKVDNILIKLIHNLIAGDNVILQTSETSINDIVYPVTSVNSTTGAITIDADFSGLASPVSGGNISNAAAWNKKIVNF